LEAMPSRLRKSGCSSTYSVSSRWSVPAPRRSRRSLVRDRIRVRVRVRVRVKVRVGVRS